MNAKDRIKDILARRVLILDGATGTHMQAFGMPQGVCPETFGCENPGLVSAMHAAYKDAGADMVTTFTFGGNRYKLLEYGITDAYGVNRELALICRRAVGDSFLIAGDIGPTGRFIEPFGDLSFEDAVAAFKEQVKGLIDGGVDMLTIETMLDIQEARAALIAVRELTDLFTIVTMTYEPHGRTLSGTDPISGLITLQALGASAVGCNCSTGPEDMLGPIRAMKPYATVPLVAKPNAGLPKLIKGRTVFDMQPDTFARHARSLAEAGVNLLGGCCGTTPEHIRTMIEAVNDLKPIQPQASSLSGVSSARGHLLLKPGAPLAVIGERINPTGKKALQAELKEGKLGIVRQFAHDQEKAGAALLDVNVGTPGIDEAAAIRAAIGLLATITDLPLSIDSARVEAVEAALRLYPGRALINSISGEKAKLERLLPLAKKYGAMFILLPLTDEGIPATAGLRRGVIERIFEQARTQGFTKDDFIVDALTMTVSAEQGAALETLATIDWCARSFGARTVIGLSNVSFGLPERRWINAGFLAMAVAKGLSLAIANPENAELMNIKLATDVLAGRDAGAKAYIERFGAQTLSPAQATMPAGKELTPAELVHRAILEGDREAILACVDKALEKGLSPDTLVNGIMIPAIRRVGELYEAKTYFLPQLIASAEAMQKAFARLEPLIKKAGTGATKGRILMATVKGDIHDIGKNIVILLLKNNGFEVIDLGKDVPHEHIIMSMQEHRPDLVGLSALMTTTMVNMPEIIAKARAADLDCPFMVGGAVVTAAYAESIGAAYAKDGVEAVKVAE
ncbi:MAG: homocysteine S-methyltransferase family protein, partial [Syntrophaceae bacterium]